LSSKCMDVCDRKSNASHSDLEVDYAAAPYDLKGTQT